MAACLLARYDLGKFKWKPLQDVPKTCVRRLGGGEQIQDIHNRHFKGLHNVFFGLTVELHDSTDAEKLALCAQECWCLLRFQFPTIASAIHGSDQESKLTYTTGNSREVSQWARRTLIIHPPSHINLEQLRVDESQKKVPSQDGDFTWINLVPGELADDGTVPKFGLLLHSHHSLFDGSAVKIIMNTYLDKLAKMLSNPCCPSGSLQWGNELENLPPAVFDILNSHEALPIPPDSAREPSFDYEYYKCLGSAMADIVATTKDAYGFGTPSKDSEWPKTRRAEVLFTREESTRLLAVVKCSELTLTHVAHAALWMVVIADNPPHPDSSSHYLNHSTAVNCRNRLNSNAHLYPGFALGFAAIRIPVSAFLSPDRNVLPLDRDMLLKVAEVAKRQYQAHLSLPSILSQSAQLGEICTSLVAQSGDTVKMPADRCYTFVSDGKGEGYLNPTFMDDAGKTVLSVAKFFLSVNTYDAEPVFRVSSWGGVIDISADYNVNVLKGEDMINHLHQWKRFMLLILG